jgi:hypothetical protein
MSGTLGKLKVCCMTDWKGQDSRSDAKCNECVKSAYGETEAFWSELAQGEGCRPRGRPSKRSANMRSREVTTDL